MKAYLFREGEQKNPAEATEYLYVPGLCLVQYSVRGSSRRLKDVTHVVHRNNGSLKLAQRFVDTSLGEARFEGYSLEEADVSKKWINEVVEKYIGLEKAEANFRHVANPLADKAVVDSINRMVSVTYKLCLPKWDIKAADSYAELVDYLLKHEFTCGAEPQRNRDNYYDLRLKRSTWDDDPVIGFFDRRDLSFKAFKGTRLEKILQRFSSRSREARGRGLSVVRNPKIN